MDHTFYLFDNEPVSRNFDDDEDLDIVDALNDSPSGAMSIEWDLPSSTVTTKDLLLIGTPGSGALFLKTKLSCLGENRSHVVGRVTLSAPDWRTTEISCDARNYKNIIWNIYEIFDDAKDYDRVLVICCFETVPVEHCNTFVNLLLSSNNINCNRNIIVFDSIHVSEYFMSEEEQLAYLSSAQKGYAFLRSLSTNPLTVEGCPRLKAPNLLYGLSAAFLMHLYFQQLTLTASVSSDSNVFSSISNVCTVFLLVKQVTSISSEFLKSYEVGMNAVVKANTSQLLHTDISLAQYDKHLKLNGGGPSHLLYS